MRRPDAVKPYAGCIATISNGKISAQIRYTETATRFGGRRPWMLCPRCGRRCRVLFLGFGRVGCRRCFRLRYHSQSLDRGQRSLHAMGKIAKRIDPEADGNDLPDKPPRTYDRLAEHRSTSRQCVGTDGAPAARALYLVQLRFCGLRPSIAPGKRQPRDSKRWWFADEGDRRGNCRLIDPSVSDLLTNLAYNTYTCSLQVRRQPRHNADSKAQIFFRLVRGVR